MFVKTGDFPHQNVPDKNLKSIERYRAEFHSQLMILMKDMKKRMEPFENCFALEFTKPKFNCCGVQQLSKSGKWTKYYSRNSDFSHFGCESRREESQTKAKKKENPKTHPPFHRRGVVCS